MKSHAKKSLAILAVLLTAISSLGQNYFFELVPGWRNNYAIEMEDSYTVFGLKTGDQIGHHEYLYNEMSLEGNMIGQFVYSVDSVESTTTFGSSQLGVEIEDAVYIASGIGNASTFTLYGTLFKYTPMDNEMELIHTYFDHTFNRLIGIVLKNDSSFLISGYHSDSGANRSAMVMETDLMGEPRWTYSSTPCGAGCTPTAQQILPLSNGHTALLYKEHDIDQPTFHDREKAVLVVLDEEGQEVWSDEPGQHEDYRIWPGGMVELDGEILLSYTDPYYYMDDGEWDSNYDCTVHFLRYSLSGTPMDSSSLAGQIPSGNSGDEFFDIFHQVTQFQKLEDSNLLLSGYAAKNGLLIKLDPVTLDVIWIRHHTPDPIEESPGVSQYTHILHTLPTSDGGFLCTGEFRSDPSIFHPSGIQTAFALKVDEYGCLEEGCGPIGLEELEVGKLRVYPNPVSTGQGSVPSGVLNVHLPLGVAVERVMLQSANGTTSECSFFSSDSGVTQKLEIHSAGIAPGLYFLILTSHDGRVFSEKVVYR